VKLLRHALEDDARSPRYVAVVRGRGYRAIATVKHCQPTTASRVPQFALVLALALSVLTLAAFLVLDEWSRPLERKPNPAAQGWYLRARHLHQSVRLDRTETAIRYYQHAIELDPRLAPAYVGLADALLMRRQLAELGPRDPARARIAALARTALEMDPTLGDAHAILGRELASSFDLQGAARELALAERASPTGEYVLRYRAQFQGCCATPVAKAIDYARKGAELDRLNPLAATNVANAYWQAHRFADALRQIDFAIELDPQFWMAHKLRTVVLDDLGRFDEALRSARATIELNDCSLTRTDIAIAYARIGDMAHARRIYDELARRAAGKYWSPTEEAMVLVALHEREAALAALERAYTERDELLIDALHTRRLAPLGGEPEFQRLVKSLEQGRPVDAR